MLPIDDHLVHRGDGVFETLKYVDGALYNLDAHLQRLLASADHIRLASPWDAAALTDLVRRTAAASKQDNGLIRILLSRGPGSMGVNPYDCPAPQLYVLAYHLPQPFMLRHPQGGSALRSSYPVKAGFLAQVKSCNYLLNALMKMEATDAGADFVFAFDEDGHLAEGPTESVGIVTRNAELCVPNPNRILPGTTMDRVLELAEQAVADGQLGGVQRRDIDASDLRHAREVLIFGTTMNVTAVTAYEGLPVDAGKPGAAYLELSRRLETDMFENTEMRTSI